MSRVIETLHGGHEQFRPHSKTRPRLARQTRLVAAAPPIASNRSAHASLAPQTAENPRRLDQAAPATHAQSDTAGSTGERVAISPSPENLNSANALHECDGCSPTRELALDTLWKLETIRPFDRLTPDARDEPVLAVQFETLEPGFVSNFETRLDVHTPEQPSASPTSVGPSVDESSEEIARTSGRRRFRVHQSAPLSLESEQATAVPVELPGDETETGKDAWAANVLAVCGGLLVLAAVLYVAVDVVFWF